MKTLILFLLMTSAHSAEINLINESRERGIDTTKPLAAMNRAKAHFEKMFGPLEEDIQVRIQDQGCLRTGYDFKQKKVVFCKTSKTHHFGLASLDVIHHELFHSFLCQKRAELCQEGLNVPAHEALADYFSYQLAPDRHFGENYYVDAPYIREYLTSFVLGYVEDDYDVANVHCSNLIKHKVNLPKALEIFHWEVPKYFQLLSPDLPPSSMSRYRLKVGETYRFETEFLDPRRGIAHGMGVSRPFPDGVEVIFTGKQQMEIRLQKKIKPSTLTIVFHDSKGEVIGRKRIYLGNALN